MFWLILGILSLFVGGAEVQEKRKPRKKSGFWNELARSSRESHRRYERRYREDMNRYADCYGNL